MDVDSMEASRELDAMIAERVMGLVPCQAGAHKDGAMWPCYAQPDSPMEGGELPCYSTDIAAAWHVVEALGERYGCHVSVARRSDIFKAPSRYLCSIEGGRLAYNNPYLRLIDIAPSVPLAICRAALKALEGQSHD